MILPQELFSSRVHRYHTSGRMETTVSIEVGSEEQNSGNLRGKRGRENIFSILAVKPAPHNGELSSSGTTEVPSLIQPNTGLGAGAVKVE